MVHKQIAEEKKQLKHHTLKERAEHRMATSERTKSGKLSESFKKFTKYGSEEYHKFNDGNEKSILPLIVRYKDCTAIGTWHLHLISDKKIYELVSKAIEKEFLDYIKVTPKEKRFVMVEGIIGGNVISKEGKVNPKMPFKDFDSAVKGRGENIGVLYLAKEYEIRAISPEPTDRECIRYLLKSGFTKDEALLFHIARQIFDKGKFNESMPQFVSHLIKESRYSNKEPTNEEIMNIIKRQNALFEKLYGKPMIIMENGTMYSNLTAIEVNRFYSPAWVVDRPKEAKLLNHMNFDVDILRNKKIVEDLKTATDSGLHPFVIYGRSHIAIIKPALDYLYGEPIEVRL
jgi:hypothetical protein